MEYSSGRFQTWLFSVEFGKLDHLLRDPVGQSNVTPRELRESILSTLGSIEKLAREAKPAAEVIPYPYSPQFVEFYQYHVDRLEELGKRLPDSATATAAAKMDKYKSRFADG